VRDKYPEPIPYYPAPPYGTESITPAPVRNSKLVRDGYPDPTTSYPAPQPAAIPSLAEVTAQHNKLV
jgi:hypothetical protein